MDFLVHMFYKTTGTSGTVH